VEYGSGKENQT